MKKMRILIADHDANFSADIAAEISAQRDMELVGICSDGHTALSMAYDLSPDLMVLDLLLPVVDGFGVIDSLRVSEDPPELLILSELTGTDIIRHINELEISNFLLKPVNSDIVVSRIRDILFGYCICCSLPAHDGEAVNPWSAILSCVSRIGIPPHMKGYHFICDAVAYMLDKGDNSLSMTKHIYPSIGAKYNTSPMTVERAIRMAITKTWKLGIIRADDPLFGYTLNSRKERPTNQEFLMAVAVAVRKECNRP